MYENGTKLKLSLEQKGGNKMQTKLISLMNDHNLKNKDIARILAISEKQVGLKIRGKVPFKDREMFCLSHFFNKTVDDIFLDPMYENGTLSNEREK